MTLSAARTEAACLHDAMESLRLDMTDWQVRAAEMEARLSPDSLNDLEARIDQLRRDNAAAASEFVA